MTETELNEIEARAKAATPGKWEYSTDGDSDDYTSWEWPQDIISRSVTFERWPNVQPGKQHPVIVANLAEAEGIPIKDGYANAEFISHARTDIPALVSEIRHLQTENTEALAAYRQLQSHAAASGCTVGEWLSTANAALTLVLQLVANYEASDEPICPQCLGDRSHEPDCLFEKFLRCSEGI